MSYSLKTTFAIATGTLLEWYDFSLFAYLAPLFRTLYFPRQDAIAALLAVFSIYAAGNATRILGAFWFGFIGDKHGRQQALIYSISLMAFATLLLAITPSYETIGITASILLVLYRLLQGFALGGEYQGNAIYLVELSNKQKGLAGSWIVTMVGLGMLMASGITTLITNETASTYVWRLAFIFGGALGLIALWVRYQLTETQRFKNSRQIKQQSFPIKLLLRQYRKQFFIALALAIGAASYNYSLVFLPTYLIFVHPYSLHEATKALMVSLLMGQFLTPLIGWLSDKKCLWLLKRFLPQRWQNSLDNKLALMMLGASATLMLAYPIYYLYLQENFIIIILTNLVIGLLCSLYLAPKNALLTELFPAHVCYTGFGLAHNLGLAIAGVAPLLLTKLVMQHHLLMAPAYYLMTSSLIALSCLVFLWCNKQLFAK